jgi:hypothetical protein
MSSVDYILTMVLLLNPSKWVYNVAKNDPKILATLKRRGKNFGGMFFDVF